MVDSASRIQQTLQNYRKAMDSFEKKLQQPKKVSAAEVRAFLTIFKRAKEEHRSEVKKIIAQKNTNAEIAKNTANAIRIFLTNLSSYKGVIETAAIQVLHELEDELTEEEKVLREEAKKEYTTVGEIEEGGLDQQ